MQSLAVSDVIEKHESFPCFTSVWKMDNFRFLGKKCDLVNNCTF
jgi:hypothetical protein